LVTGEPETYNCQKKNCTPDEVQCVACLRKEQTELMAVLGRFLASLPPAGVPSQLKSPVLITLFRACSGSTIFSHGPSPALGYKRILANYHFYVKTIYAKIKLWKTGRKKSKNGPINLLLGSWLKNLAQLIFF
jgi:hypothetical protein